MQITLQPFKLKGNKFIPVSKEYLTLDWNSYKKLLSVSESKNSFLLMRKVRAGYFIGIKNHKDQKITFIYSPQDSSNGAHGLLKMNPEIQTEIETIYKVIKTDFGCSVKI